MHKILDLLKLMKILLLSGEFSLLPCCNFLQNDTDAFFLVRAFISDLTNITLSACLSYLGTLALLPASTLSELCNFSIYLVSIPFAEKLFFPNAN